MSKKDEPARSSDTEVWLPVVGYEGYYEVSNTGLVKSLERVTKKPKYNVLVKERILSAPISHGYPVVVLYKDGKRRQSAVHSLVLEAFVGKRPDGHQACHFDGNRANAMLSNLRWGTQAENEEDKKRHGTYQYGERNPSARLSDEQVAEIRLSQLPPSIISKRYGITRGAVHDIRNGRRRSVPTMKPIAQTP